MKVAIMQPYFLPYIGYYQLINSVDLFILYDNIKYTKKGWINRNRMLQNGKDVLFSIPLKNDSDFLDIRDRKLDPGFKKDKLLNVIRSAYQLSPYFKQAFPLIEQVIKYDDSNLFGYLHNSIIRTCEYLKIKTKIAISSVIQIDHSLKNQDKVIAFCKKVGATVYINAIGGLELYAKEDFQSNGVELKFIKSKPFEYKQFGNEFVPCLSILDVIMFNPVDTVNECIVPKYELI